MTSIYQLLIINEFWQQILMVLVNVTMNYVFLVTF